jgi:hypothetical protein
MLMLRKSTANVHPGVRRKRYATTKCTKDTKVSEIDLLEFLSFVLFATFVVKCPLGGEIQ